MEVISDQIMHAKRLQGAVGGTPLFEITNVFKKFGVSLFSKLEWMQLGGSVKSRPAFNMILEALKSGALSPHKTLLDASSGNTAIAYAAVGAALGINITICLPENASNERKDILKAHGANLIYTSKFGGTDEAQIKAKELVREQPERYFYADQYNNPNNWRAHYNTTAEEIYKQTNGQITHLVVALGTTGTAMGTYRKLHELKPSVQLITLQPELAMHNLEGWKHLETAIVPGIYQPQLASSSLEIDGEEALALIPKVAKSEGLLISPSAAGNLLGAIRVAEKIDKGTVVTLFPDNAEKYSEILKHIMP